MCPDSEWWLAFMSVATKSQIFRSVLYPPAQWSFKYYGKLNPAEWCLKDGLKCLVVFLNLDISFVICITIGQGCFCLFVCFVLEGGESCPNTYPVGAKLSGSLTHCPLALAHCPQCIKNDVVELYFKNIINVQIWRIIFMPHVPIASASGRNSLARQSWERDE